MAITPSHAGCTVQLMEKIAELEQANSNLHQYIVVLQETFAEDMAGANHALARLKHDIPSSMRMTSSSMKMLS